MGNNYNIKINPKLPSSEDIARHKDFGALLKQYREQKGEARRKRMRRLRIVSAGSAIAAAIAAVAIVLGGVFTAPAPPSLTAEEYFARQEFVHPPIEEAKPAFTSFRVDANQGGVYEYPSGSRLVIPAAAFADDYGRLIEGEVDVRYREMHDFVDFFLAGIPMAYDSAGVAYNLESAGMIEIYAEQNGKRVKLAPGKNIDVELVSEIILPRINLNVPPRYNIYQLDTFSRRWMYHDIDQIQMIGEEILDKDDPLFAYKEQLIQRMEAIENQAATRLGAIEATIPKPVEPLRPQAADGNLPTLELNFLDGSVTVEDTENGKLQNELAKLQQTYQGIIWQISPSSPAYDERAFNVNWQSVRIRPVNNRDYELTLIHPQNQLTLIVSPVLLGEDYQRAINRYQQELDKYEAALAEREEQLREQKEAVLAEVERQKAEAFNTYESQLAELRAQGTEFGEDTRYLVRRKVINRFKATAFGIWNCDRPVPPSEQQILASFRDQHGNTYRNHTAYLVDKSRNTVFRFYATEDTPLHFNAHSENILWVVTDDNKIAVLRPEAFKRINQKKDSYTFQLQLVDKAIRNEEDVRDILQF